jgi:hypothetical protein
MPVEAPTRIACSGSSSAHVTADSGKTMLPAGSPNREEIAVQAYSILASDLYKDQRAYDIRSAGECMGLIMGKEHDVTGANV